MAKTKGADHFILSSDKTAMAGFNGKLNLILNTISAEHDLTTYLDLLGHDGTIVQLGLSPKPHPVS